MNSKDGVKDLNKQWKHITEQLDITLSVDINWWVIIVRRYSEEWRLYHTLNHLIQMFDLFEQWKVCIGDLHSVCLAIFFHEYVMFVYSLGQNKRKVGHILKKNSGAEVFVFWKT